MDRLHFTRTERELFVRINEEGFGQKTHYMWWPVRLAVAKSLRLEEPPGERFRTPPTKDRESELHMIQVTGRGQRPDPLTPWPKDPDYDDAIRLLIAVRHGEDVFADDDRYVDLLQRHARRGLELIGASWAPGRSFHDWLLQELFEGVAVGDADPSDEVWIAGWPAIERGLAQIGVKAEPTAEPIAGPRLTRYPLILNGVEDYDRLRKRLGDLAFAVGIASGALSLTREAGERRVVLDVPRPSAAWKTATWTSLRSALKTSSRGLPVAPGVDILNDPFVFDLTEAPHLFVAGATGSGKSVCLNAILLSLLQSREAPELVIIDPKGVDFVDYEGCARLRDRKVVTDMAEGAEVLRTLVQEMEARQVALREFGARNIGEALAAGSEMRRLVVVIDELADFLMDRPAAEDALVRLAQKARAVGIHLVLATQRPEAATFKGLLRSNIPSRIALTVQKATDSRIILDEAGAETLLMRGDMLVKLAGRDPVRVHGAQVTAQDVRSAVAAVNTL